MDHTRLKTFQVVSDLLSFRKASQELHLTQPAVTAQIKALEESLGVLLFLRTKRSVVLTRAGETLLGYARKIEDLRNQALIALSGYGSLEQSEISIGASHTASVSVLPRLLPRVLKNWPRVHLRVITGSSREVVHALTEGRISLAVIEGDAVYPGLRAEAFGRDELVMIVAANHAWAHKQKISDLELIGQPIILSESGSSVRSAVEDYLETAQILSKIRCVASIDSAEATIAAVEAGTGVGFVPRQALERITSAHSVKAIALENGPIFQSLNFVLPEGPDPQGPVWQITGLLRESFARDGHSIAGAQRYHLQTEVIERVIKQTANAPLGNLPVVTP
jgi:DNA-binding transcriptional LysR family regulator